MNTSMLVGTFLHTFSDASDYAFVFAIYLTEENGGESHLIFGKSSENFFSDFSNLGNYTGHTNYKIYA
jgi:hypothetical protein